MTIPAGDDKHQQASHHQQYPSFTSDARTAQSGKRSSVSMSSHPSAADEQPFRAAHRPGGSPPTTSGGDGNSRDRYGPPPPVYKHHQQSHPSQTMLSSWLSQGTRPYVYPPEPHPSHHQSYAHSHHHHHHHHNNNTHDQPPPPRYSHSHGAYAHPPPPPHHYHQQPQQQHHHHHHQHHQQQPHLSQYTSHPPRFSHSYPSSNRHEAASYHHHQHSHHQYSQRPRHPTDDSSSDMMDVDEQAPVNLSDSPRHSRQGERITSKYFGQSHDDSRMEQAVDEDEEEGGEGTDDHPRSAPIAHLDQPVASPAKKRGRKPKPRPEGEPVKPVKPRKPREPKAPKEPKQPKEPKPPKVPKEKKIKEPKEPKVRKNAKTKQDEPGDANGKGKSDRSILNYFDKTGSGRSNGSYADDGHGDSENALEERHSSPATPKSFKQSCLSFDVIDSSNPRAYFLNQPYEDVNPFRHLLKELPKLVGRAPYEDLSDGMLARSSRIPNIRGFDVTYADFDMDTLAEVKMIHEFLNTFGTSLSLTLEEGEWISFDSLVSMLRNPKIDDRLVDLHCRLVRAAYEPDDAPEVDQYNFTYYLAAGPEVFAGADDKQDAKMARAMARAVRLGRPPLRKGGGAHRRKKFVLDRLGDIEFSQYTLTDRIASLAKAIHDIMSTPKFHQFMTFEVEENILTLKRQKRKRTEARKELEVQTQELERGMKAIERQAAELESRKQALLALERDGTPGEEDQQAGGVSNRSSASRLQRLAQTKEARAKVAALTNEQKALAHELKLKESICDTKREELEGVIDDDFEIQKDHNVILSRLRGGNVVNTDDKLRVLMLGSDRFGRKYWFWKGFGGIIVEDRGQVGPKQDANHHSIAVSEPTVKAEGGDGTPKTTIDVESDAVIAEVITKMESMADPELTGGANNAESQSNQGEEHKATSEETGAVDKARVKSASATPSNRHRMSITSLLIDASTDTTTLEENITTKDEDSESDVNHESKIVVPEPRASATTSQSPDYRRLHERDMLDYGPIQTWGLISTNKELASLIRVLNHKGVRERILKANLLTMRKQIEASFVMVKKWARVADLNEPRSGADGGDLILEALKKKRGRKSKEELAEIAARMESLQEANAAAAAAAAAAASVAGGDSGQTDEAIADGDNASGQQDDIMEVDHDANQQLQEQQEQEQHGITGEEYYCSMVQTTEGKLCALSGVLCEGSKEDVLAKFIAHARTLVEEEDALKVIVACLKLCLEALQEKLEEVEETSDQEGDKAGAPEDEKESGNSEYNTPEFSVISKSVKKEDKDAAGDIDMDEDENEEEEEQASTSIASPELIEKIGSHPSVIGQDGLLPILEQPRLYWWLKARRVDEMLDSVRTYGGLHAWLEICKRAIESMVDEGDHGDDDEEDAHRSGEEDEEGEDADDHEHDDHDEEDAEDDDQADDDDEADEAGDDKSQEHDEEEAEEEDEPRRGRSRYSKAKKQLSGQKSPSIVTTSTTAGGTRVATRSISNTTTAGGMSLRSRRGAKVNYNDDASSRFDHDDEGIEEDEEDEDAPALRRSKRRRR